MHADRRGVALLEVIVALFIVATAGTALVSMTRQTLAAVERARDSDRDTRDANAYLGIVSLWPREDLDRHLGTRIQSHWRMRVLRPTPVLYVVSLTDSSAARPIMETVLYRPDTVLAQP